MKKIMFDDHYGLTKAVLEGVKTMTRRIIYDFSNYGWGSVIDAFIENGVLYLDTGLPSLFAPKELQPKYNIGEVVAIAQRYTDIEWRNNPYCEIPDLSFNGQLAKSKGWKNKMYVRADLMPHRIRITNVRVERIQDISDEDCLREGIYEVPFCEFAWDDNGKTFKTAREAFAALIKKMAGKKAWDDNPWVFVYSFELIK